MSKSNNKPKKNAAAVKLGRSGGKARMSSLTKAERSELARKAGLASAASKRKARKK